MLKYCNIIEFYDNKIKKLEYIKSKLIIDFLLESNVKKVDSSSLFLKKLLESFFDNKRFKKYKLYNLLYHLKQTYDIETNIYRRQMYKDEEPAIRMNILKFFRGFPISEWVSMENIFNYYYYRELELDVIMKIDAIHYFYFNKKYSWDDSSYGYEKNTISTNIYRGILLFLRLGRISAFSLVISNALAICLRVELGSIIASIYPNSTAVLGFKNF